jgi:hypothetical protein
MMKKILIFTFELFTFFQRICVREKTDYCRIFQLMITIFVQYFFMRNLEKLIGWHRMAIIYMFSGIGGEIKFRFFLKFYKNCKAFFSLQAI